MAITRLWSVDAHLGLRCPYCVTRGRLRFIAAELLTPTPEAAMAPPLPVPSVTRDEPPRVIKTHCPHGHALAGENLYVNPRTGKRQCRTCRDAALCARTQAMRATQQAQRNRGTPMTLSSTPEEPIEWYRCAACGKSHGRPQSTPLLEEDEPEDEEHEDDAQP